MSSFPPPPPDPRDQDSPAPGPRDSRADARPGPDGYPVYEAPDVHERRAEPPPPPSGPTFPGQAPGPFPPAPPTPGTPRAGEIGERILARVLDAMIISVASVVVGGVTGFVLAFVVTGSTAGRLAVSTALFVVGAVIVLGYYAVLESGTGATLGKRAMRLRVVGPDGHSFPTFAESVKRNIFLVFYPLGIMPTENQPLTPSLSLIIAVSIIVTIGQDQATRRGWHDKFAGTRVLKD
ncbi:RDD family protein [Nocardioides nanhaiensis]|uniref:RDD domain-containing protein n=1 Tax=Nocardioides nanhaiensis TaxID=1476871 RepID=A0ABP8WKR6_9ACTN